MAESGASSPNSAAATEDAHHEGSESTATAAVAVAAMAAQAPPPLPPAKVRFMVSYGGRIQPRSHDNQLSYVNGDTKILSIERPLRFPDFAARLAALTGSRGDLSIKYQLPGEDLDALVSVTNDEDLEHLVLEYDRLHQFRPAPGSGGGSSRGAATPRLRVFLFPVQAPPPPPQPTGLLEPKPEQRHWFVDALNSVSPPPPQHQPQPKQETVPIQAPPPAVPMAMPQTVMLAAQTSPDFLFGLDYGYGFVPPPAVKVKDPAGDPPTVRENVPVEIPAKNDDRHPNPTNDQAVVSPVVAPAEFQRQILELEKLQVTDTANQQPPPAPAPAAPAASVAPATPAASVAPAALSRNGSDDSLTRAIPPAATATTTAATEYFLPKFPEKPSVQPASSAPPATAFLPVQGRYPSAIPVSGAEPGPFFYIPQPPHYYAAAGNHGANSFPAVYAVAPHNANTNGNTINPALAVSNAPAYAQVAYDSNGRAMYYTSVLPQYPSAVNGVPASQAVLSTEPPKPVAVKPTVS